MKIRSLVSLAALAALLAGQVTAEPLSAEQKMASDGTVFKTSDDSAYTQLCLAALESREALESKAQALEIRRRELDKVVCNDMSLVEFAKTHRDDMREWAIATVQ